MALALYRKYRPATFAEVVGQEHVTDPLRAALSAGRINHAYLFSGPRGCGKTSSARIMARSLNCVEGPTSDPCGLCGPCTALAPEGPGSIDVTELDAASHGGVDDARDLRERAFYAPAESRYRLFIIDEAHMVTAQGFNALLKVVEEPPEHLIFIFATTEPDKVLTTIRSRTHHYPFRLVPPSAMRELLERNVAAEKVTVEPAVFPLVIRAGGGSARDTQSVLDQLLAGAGPQGVTYDHAAALLGVTDVALIDAMIDALAAEDAKNVFDTIDHLAEAGLDPRRFATDLLDRLRDLILLRSVPDAAESGLVTAPEEQVERMMGQTERLQPATLTRYAETMHQGLLDMRGATAPRLVLELLCARMLLPEVSEDERSLLQRLERLERRVTVGGPAGASDPTGAGDPAEGRPSEEPRQPPAPGAERDGRAFQRPSQQAPATEAAPPTPSSAPAIPAETGDEPEGSAVQSETVSATTPSESPAREHGEIDVAALRQYWPQVLAVVRTLSRSTEALLTGASIHDVTGSTVVLTHTAAPLVRRLSEQRNIDCIATALSRVVSGEWHIRCVHAETAQTPGGEGTAQRGQQSRPGSETPEPRGAASSWSSTPSVSDASEPPEPASRTELPAHSPEGRAVTSAGPGTGAAPGRGAGEGELPDNAPGSGTGAVAGSSAHASTGGAVNSGGAVHPATGMDEEPPGTADPDPQTRVYRLLSEHLSARPLE